MQGDDKHAEDLFRESLQRAQAAGLLHNQIEALEELAGVLVRRREVRRAACWLFVSQAWREVMGIPVPPSERERYDAVIRLVQSMLDQAALEVIQSQANTLTLDQVITEALNLSSVVAEPKESIAPTKTATPELRILALGPTRVTVGENVRTAADWTYAKSKELLFYLLTRPPTTKAQIGLALWPDSSASQLRRNFHSALHHLRRALGRADWIVFDDGAYRFNRDLSYWCDVHIFEDRLNQARRIEMAGSPQSARARAIQLLDEATQLWHGDFLEDLDAGEWAIFLREELRRKMIDALIHLGQLHFANAHYHEAAETYRHVLSFDNYLELAHRELMRCHARQGEISQALRHYQQLCDLLQRELHARPSSETTLLFERLRRGDDI
jgi:DNA-binding SARP family transcriptional activator